MTAFRANLSDLLGSLAIVPKPWTGEVYVAGVSADTRELKGGELFVALPGEHVDGADYIPRAISLGAAAVVTQRPFGGTASIPVIEVPDARTALSRLASEYYGNPSRELRVVGITGTDGKTTTTFLTDAVLSAAGYTTGFITTVDVKIGARQWRSSERVTTPQPPSLHRRLREMVDAGVEYAIVESSSHGLRLSRLDDVAYDVAVMTNVTSEHLELHGSVERYRLDKAKLFSMLGESADKGVGKWGVINADDPNADLFERACAGRTITYGTSRWADVVAQEVQHSMEGLAFRVRTAEDEVDVRLPLLGAYNVYNALAAVSVGLSQGIPLGACSEALRGFGGVPGRMQRIEEGQSFGVVVDYAHTADSLEKVLRTLRQATRGRLIAVFGSAGERNRSKRPEMGGVAARYADFAVLTDEDPRGEDSATILREIAAGAEAAGAREGEQYVCLADRSEAIREALVRARAGDMVLLAGKGHESSIEYADQRLPWNEVEVTRQLLVELRAAS